MRTFRKYRRKYRKTSRVSRRSYPKRTNETEKSKNIAWSKYYDCEKEKSLLSCKLKGLERQLKEREKSNDWLVPQHFAEEYTNLIKDKKEDYDCSICLEPLKNELFFVPKCMHKFHRACVENMVYTDVEKKRKQCAVCRNDFVFE